MAAGPPETCELSSLITAATKPQVMPVATPRKAARRDGDPPARSANAMTIATTTRVTTAVSHHRPAGAWSRPPDGAAARRKTLIPAHPGPRAPRGRQQRQVAEDEQQLERQNRLHEGQRAEPQGAHLEPESGDH